MSAQMFCAQAQRVAALDLAGAQRHAAGAGHRLQCPFGASYWCTEATWMTSAGVHEAVAGVHHHRRGVDRLALEQLHDGGGGHLGVLVGHVAALGHGAPGRARRPARGCPCTAVDSMVSQFTPAQRWLTLTRPACTRDLAGALRRHDVEHVGLHRPNRTPAVRSDRDAPCSSALGGTRARRRSARQRRPRTAPSSTAPRGWRPAPAPWTRGLARFR
jgi:hypothetical protein